MASFYNPYISGCTSLSANITACKAKGIKVLLCIGSGTEDYTLNSTADARKLTTYIWNNFLDGKLSDCPLGDAVLDGVDCDIEGETSQHWDKLASFLSTYNKRGKKVYLTMAPQCLYPDAWVGGALKTCIFDYAWVQFYNNSPCQYTPRDVADH